MIEYCFDDYSELDQIQKFSSPKVLRLIEILRQIRPHNFVDPRKRRERNSSKIGTPVEELCLETKNVNENDSSDEEESFKQALEELGDKQSENIEDVISCETKEIDELSDSFTRVNTHNSDEVSNFNNAIDSSMNVADNSECFDINTCLKR